MLYLGLSPACCNNLFVLLLGMALAPSVVGIFFLKFVYTKYIVCCVVTAPLEVTAFLLVTACHFW